ncbi:peroxidase [Anabrus simplex]|uniref:peroxidase n=1 Tax=Anabrus simplex TaxID=316456 RepID=UPI0035A2B353
MFRSKTTILFWLSVSLGSIRADECGENVVKMVTVDGSKDCKLRINTDPLKDDGNKTDSAILKGLIEGTDIYRRNLAHEEDLAQMAHVNATTVPKSGIAEYFKQALVHQSKASAIAAAVTEAFDMPRFAGGDVLTFLNLPIDDHSCTPDPICDVHARYRTYDGSCNNLEHPKWGMAGEAFTRLLLPVYEDGIFTPRKAVDSSDLPSGRLLRTTLIRDKNNDDSINTLAVMQWGQIVAHDVAATSNQVGFDGLPMECCTLTGNHLDPSLQSSSCLPLDVPADDYFYSNLGKSCLNLPRSNATFAFNCRFSYGESINDQSHLLDGSVVYGASAAMANRLREKNGGRLRVRNDNGRDMLPLSPKPVEDCLGASDEFCLLSGDNRANQNPQLTALQVILMREHNRLATELEQLNPTWDDETLFQETRRIVAAIIQHITYKELLPIYLGDDYSPLQEDPNETYNPELNPSTINSFAGAAYRTFHGLAQGKLELVEESRFSIGCIHLMEWFFRPSVVETPSENLDLLLRGLVFQPSQSADPFSTAALSDRTSDSFDISSLDIERGRERGIPPYNDYRELCGLARASTFEDFQDTIAPELVRNMKTLYEDPNDVDLFIGGFLETPVRGALVGPTFRCIVGEQFYRFKFGDRFFYEFTDFHNSFTEAQLTEIRKASLSKLLCDNGDNISHMQPNSFRKISEGNPLEDCDAIPAINLLPWKEE